MFPIMVRIQTVEFFSSTDQKCLVAWLENDGNCLKVRTIENHHNRIPIHVLLQAESFVLGDIVFLKDQPSEESFADEYTVWCRIGVHRLKMPLPGYLYPGVSWWRFRKNVKNLAGFIQKHNLDGTEPIILEGQQWHDKEKRWSRWQERLPVSFPTNLLKAGKSGIIPDWVAITHL